MRKVSSVTPSLKYELNGLHQVVVQKGNVATKYICVAAIGQRYRYCSL